MRPTSDPAPTPDLAGGSVDQHLEAARYDRSTLARSARCRLGSGLESGGGEIDAMGLRIQRHRPGARLRLQHLNHCQLGWRILVRDGDRALAVGAECQLQTLIEG